MTKELDKNEARQGKRGMAEVVLFASAILAVIAAIGVYIYGEQTDTEATLEERVERMEEG